MNKVFVTRQIPDIGLELLASKCQLDVWPGELPPSRAELIEHIQPADGLLCLLSDRIDEEILQYAPSLKVISNYAVGFDNIDVAAATRRGIPVGNTPGVLTHATADFAFALLMAAARRVPEASPVGKNTLGGHLRGGQSDDAAAIWPVLLVVEEADAAIVDGDVEARAEGNAMLSRVGPEAPHPQEDHAGQENGRD